MTFIDHNREPGKPRAIETVFDGYRFRSRLEAKWYLFFSMMQIKCVYEEQGFELPSGRYLPDFFLPEVEVFVEVKPYIFFLQNRDTLYRSKNYSVTDNRDIKRAFELATETGYPVKFACGDPAEDFCRGDVEEAYNWTDYPGTVICPLNEFRQASYNRQDNLHRMLAKGPLIAAAMSVRATRFEFGGHP